MCSRSIAFVAFSAGKPISTFPENSLTAGRIEIDAHQFSDARIFVCAATIEQS
jgi:hypothetical protein